MFSPGFSGCTLAASFVAVALAGRSASAVDADTADLTVTTFVHTGAPTTQPKGHFEFCKLNPDQCGEMASAARLPAKQFELVRLINADVNRDISPMSDMAQHDREELWSYPDSKKGDCEDYALEKRRRMIRAGLLPSDLLITVVRKRNGEGHAVLTVRMEDGDYIADNLSPLLSKPQYTPYNFVKIQDPNNAGAWVEIVNEPVAAVASTSSAGQMPRPVAP